jgi:chromosome segregation ATPase
MTQHVNHRASDEISQLRAEAERLTKDRDEWRAQCNEAEAERDDYKSQINEAWAAAQAELCKSIDMRKRAESAERKLQQRADELNVLQGSIAAYQAGELERKLVMAVEAMKHIANVPAWGAPDKWESTPSELRQFASKAAKEAG